MKRFILAVSALMSLGIACNLSAPKLTSIPPTATPPAPVEVIPTATPTSEPTVEVVLPEDVCLFPADDQTLFISEAGGYCFLLPDTFTTSQDLGLDIFAVGPTLADFGMNRLSLIVEFRVLGAPGGAGENDALSWATKVAARNSSDDFELTVEPYQFEQIDISGVLIGPMPGLVTSEIVYVRVHDTLYSIAVYPDRETDPEYRAQVEEVWAQIGASMRFFHPIDTGVVYRTEREVCPDEQAGTHLAVDLEAGWCALIPEGWREDVEFNFLGRFVGGPNIGDFWPGQPPYANITIGFSGPVAGITLEERVQGRINANGRPDLVQRTNLEIGGFPAVILDSKDGPHPDRVALIHANGYSYSVLGQPFDPELYAEAQPELEMAWETIINSIQFFEPYR